jgi:hypothetical protein
VRKLSGERKIRHPWTCVFLGHFVSTTGRRFGLSEYMCRNCGHPFLFPVTAADRCLRPATRTCYQ